MTAPKTDYETCQRIFVELFGLLIELRGKPCSLFSLRNNGPIQVKAICIETGKSWDDLCEKVLKIFNIETTPEIRAFPKDDFLKQIRGLRGQAASLINQLWEQKTRK